LIILDNIVIDDICRKIKIWFR